MNFVSISALALIVGLIALDARSAEEQCLFDRTKPTNEPTCVHVEFPPAVAPVIVITTKADAAAVAAMPMLPQIDTMMKKVAAE